MTLRSSAEPPFPCSMGRSSTAPCPFTRCTDPQHRCSVPVYLFPEAPQQCSMPVHLFPEAPQQCSGSVSLFPDAEQHCSMILTRCTGLSHSSPRVRDNVL